MPKKAGPPTLEQARARLDQAIRRYANAQVDRATAGVVNHCERLRLKRYIEEMSAQVTWARQDLEDAVRRECTPLKSDLGPSSL